MFDALVATLQDTRLEPDLEDLLWALSNIFHRAGERLERLRDDNEVAPRRSVREPAGSEVGSVERERLLREGTSTIARKSVVEGKSVAVRVGLGGRRIIKHKKATKTHND